MKQNEVILSILTQYLKDNPTIRFGQALFNLNINKLSKWDNHFHLLEDIYNDTDEQILKRMTP